MAKEKRAALLKIREDYDSDRFQKEEKEQKEINEIILIKYSEFLVSGKILIISKTGGNPNLPTSAWLERIKNGFSVKNAATWTGHLNWYKTRRNEAMAWLIRKVREIVSTSVYLSHTLKAPPGALYLSYTHTLMRTLSLSIYIPPQLLSVTLSLSHTVISGYTYY